MSEFSKPAEDLLQAAKEYADLRIDDLKLRTAKGLTVAVSKLLGLILILGVVLALLLLLSFGLVLLVGEWIGSYGLAALMVAGVVAVVLLVLLKVRDKLFQGTFVSLFVKLFFAGHEESELSPDQDA